jgi:hypothetical protein
MNVFINSTPSATTIRLRMTLHPQAIAHALDSARREETKTTVMRTCAQKDADAEQPQNAAVSKRLMRNETNITPT